MAEEGITLPRSDYDNVCRICIKAEGNSKYLSLFEPFKGFCSAYYINLLISISFRENDELPQQICNNCLLDLETVIKFKQKCEESDVYLHQTINEIKAKSELLSEIEQFGEVKVKEELSFVDSEETNSFEEDNYVEKTFPMTELKSDLKKNNLNNIFIGSINTKVPVKGSIMCHDCGEVFRSICKLRVHWKKVHKPNVYFVCDLCKDKFGSVLALNQHKINKKCEILSSIVSIDGIGKQRTFLCLKCDFKSKRKNDVLSHRTTHTGELKAQCSQYNKWFYNKGSLSTHIENVHKQYKQVFTCKVCGLELFGQQNFYKHVKRKHKMKDVYYECDICHKRLKSKSTLIEHFMRHEVLKKYNCEFCSKVVTTISELLGHKNRVLLNKQAKKVYDCTFCQYKGASKFLLASHIEKHNTSDLIPCEICGKFFDAEIKL